MDSFIAHLQAWAKMYGAVAATTVAAAINYWFGLADGEPFVLKDMLKASWLVVLGAGGASGLIANRVNGQNVQVVAQSAMVRMPWPVAVLGVLLVATMLSGCVNGKVNPYSEVSVDTSRKGIAVVLAEVRAANLLLQEVVRTEVISADTASTIFDQLEARKGDLRRAAVAVAMTGDPTQADSALGKAATTLAIVLETLAPYVTKSQLNATPTETDYQWAEDFLQAA